MKAIETFMASVRHAARNQETVTIDGGVYTPQELKAVTLAHAQMVEALRIIASQSIGSDWTKEEAFDFMRDYARKTIGPAEGTMEHIMNKYNHPRGKVCVLREERGELTAFAVIGNWPEWSGAFSII